MNKKVSYAYQYLSRTETNNKSVASDTSIIGFAMSKGRIFTNPNTAKSIVIIKRMNEKLSETRNTDSNN